MPDPRGVFVTGTDTGAGKTIVAATVCAVLRARGVRVAAFKPVVTGVLSPGGLPGAEPPDDDVLVGAEPPDDDALSGAGPPDDDVLLAACCGVERASVTPFRFPEPASPHLAAELAGTALDPDALVRAARTAGAGAEALVVEGVGGLLVPLTLTHSIRDLAAALGFPVIVAARPGLGTINHVRLTVESARGAGLDVRAVVLGPWPSEPSVVERSNRETIAALCELEVVTLPFVEAFTPVALAAAGAALDPEPWLDVARTAVEPG